MLKILLRPFVTSAKSGVSTRYLTVIVTTAITVLGLLGWVDDDTSDALKKAVPELLAAIAGIIAIIVPVYATISQSSSDKAHEAAQKIDAELPASAKVEIVTPGSKPNIIVQPDKSGR